MSELAPQFPLASGAVTPLRTKAEAAGSGDYSPLWSGQAAAFGREIPAGDLTRQLGAEALARLSRLAPADSSRPA
jgi:nitronate monooxygenase